METYKVFWRSGYKGGRSARVREIRKTHGACGLHPARRHMRLETLVKNLDLVQRLSLSATQALLIEFNARV